MSTMAKMLMKMLATLCRIPEICPNVVAGEECTLSKRVEEQVREDERVVDLVVNAGHFVPLERWRARGAHKSSTPSF